ncbi:hypothetical protein LMG32289_01242 [Cupriavidus pampae]|uniref:Uncharacterized protein n=1 Tax=Cupriavidus pampae TaxID=659251 RepID=A0ABM8WHU7_9BURK|nr:hypothetical protein LMG32289_01242 [Cupriavidus pampae]
MTSGDTGASDGQETQDRRLRKLRHDAFRLLSGSAEEARHASGDGMLMVDGALVAVAPRARRHGAVAPDEPGLMITAEAGYRLESETLTRVKSSLALAGELLLRFGASIGCDAQGGLTLNRWLAARHLTVDRLAAEITATRQLQRLIESAPEGSDGTAAR